MNPTLLYQRSNTMEMRLSLSVKSYIGFLKNFWKKIEDFRIEAVAVVSDIIQTEAKIFLETGRNYVLTEKLEELKEARTFPFSIETKYVTLALKGKR
ncbi:hypothetical protein CH370_12880 [Leptospira kmetyi]|nr:hypothetical protein CH370_12880 [Leptospira kmetyi]